MEKSASEIDKRWVEIFTHFKNELIPYENSVILVEITLCSTGTNAAVGRVFSIDDDFRTSLCGQSFFRTRYLSRQKIRRPFPWPNDIRTRQSRRSTPLSNAKDQLNFLDSNPKQIGSHLWKIAQSFVWVRIRPFANRVIAHVRSALSRGWDCHLRALEIIWLQTFPFHEKGHPRLAKLTQFSVTNVPKHVINASLNFVSNVGCIYN
ncbi:hypothetical protein TNCV_2858831 [Trichonephila clavipes]|nr:hypothetical protein TNCV_2858831 [Trichonephila clavipes]